MGTVSNALVRVSVSVYATNRLVDVNANATETFALVSDRSARTCSKAFIGVTLSVSAANRHVEIIADTALTLSLICHWNIGTCGDTFTCVSLSVCATNWHVNGSANATWRCAFNWFWAGEALALVGENGEGIAEQNAVVVISDPVDPTDWVIICVTRSKAIHLGRRDWTSPI